MIKCVVPVSGGKDSQLCLELALKRFKPEEVLAMFCDTGYEKRQTYAHVGWMEEYYGVEFARIREGTVYEKIYKYGRFPSDNVRFCTDELKIRPGKYFYSMLARLQGSGFEVWYGMRLGESYARSVRYADVCPDTLVEPRFIMPSKYPKYLSELGVMFRLPILRYEEEEVFAALGGRHNTLYDDGFDRVGCFPCLAAGDTYKEKAFSFDAEGKRRRIEVLNIANDIKKNVFTTKGGRSRNTDFVHGNEAARPTYDDAAPCFHCNI